MRTIKNLRVLEPLESINKVEKKKNKTNVCTMSQRTNYDIEKHFDILRTDDDQPL